MPTRRTILMGGSALVLAAASPLRAQTAPPVPILFVHGNGDHAALWMTTLWRFETNGWPRDRLHAFNFTDPLSRADDAVPLAGRSGTADQLRELAAEVEALCARTGAARIALVASSRGGNAVRNYVVEAGGAARVSHAVLCGTPNRGVFNWEASPGSEFNGRGPFLTMINRRDSDVVPGTAFLTLRSDGNDKFAQPDGRIIGRPGVATGITAEGPALRGAANLALGQLDHREVAFHPRAFREIHRFIADREPSTLAVAPEQNVRLSGLVTGNAGDVTKGVATDATTTVRLPAADTGRTVVGLFNEERIAARAWSAAENRVAIAELTW